MKKYNKPKVPAGSLGLLRKSNTILLERYYFRFLCLFFRKRFLRLWVAILCLFLFFPLGIQVVFSF